MTAKIQILPTGHEFSLEKGESILEGGLRHGKALEYSCNNGTCGDCKAKLISGQVEKIGFSDYCFSREEKREGTVLLCCVTAAQDAVLEAHEFAGVDDIPLQSIAAKVSAVERVAEDWVVLNVKTPRSKSLHFLAGQQATLSFKGLPVRNKSIASCPCNGRHLQFHVHRSGGVFSDYVFNTLKPGVPIQIDGPVGAFVLDDDTSNPLTFIAYDAGFAPIKSLLDHVFALELTQPLKLFWLSSEPKPYLHALCRSWHDAMDNFDFEVINVSQQPSDILRGVEHIVGQMAHLTTQSVLMTLPAQVLAPARQVLLSAGVLEAQLMIDKIEKYDAMKA